MDSPESSKLTATNCETAPAQESPVFNFLSNLSPIQTVRAPPVTQVFPELNSPPLVFTSPQLNLHRRSAFLKSRAQFPRASAANLAGHDEDGKGYGRLNIQLSTRLEKATHSNCPANDSASPAGSTDQFLADIVDVESVDQKFSNNPTSENFEYINMSPDTGTGTKENVVNHSCNTNSRTSEQTDVVPDVISGQTEEVLEENMLIDVDAVEKDTNLVDGVSSDNLREIEHKLTLGRPLNSQTKEDNMTENVKVEQADHSDQSDHFHSGSVDIGKENEIHVAATGAALAEPAPMRLQVDLEVFQHRRVHRRCLQFEDAQHKVISSQAAKSTLGCVGFSPTALETSSTPNSTHDEVVPSTLCSRNSLNSTKKIPKPSGIGLHLNSIVNAVQAGSVSKVSLRSSQWGNFCIVGKKSMHVNESHPVDCSNSSSLLPLVENTSASTDDNRHESHASAPVTSAIPLSTCIAKPSNDSIILNSLEDQSTSGFKRKCTEKAGGSKELAKLSPQKKRMKLSDPGESGGCKRCNCKKSKCLKLYCDCFAAGIYCAEPCACQDCFNTPEHEETVIETRQKIESRDPLAFAPRVVQRITVQPPNIHREDGTPFTPSSARHKRGCKCKKSMCLKKYCECYQANVGCSDGCRCEGCQNVFGQKGGVGARISILADPEEYCLNTDVLCEEDTNEIEDGLIPEKCKIMSGIAVSHTEYINTHHLTPRTPAFELSNPGKDASKSWFSSGEYSQSPETDFTYVAPYMITSGSPVNSDDINSNMITENTLEIIPDLSSFDHDSQPNLRKCADDSVPQSFSRKRQYYPLGGGSLGWGGSPNTPVPQFSGTKLLREVESGGLLSSGVQDDTPEMLKDSSTPANGVKVCSPNKKRVSPPHGRPGEFGSSSSVGIRTGRKFILKAVPTFPPLTPCIDSKSAAVDKSTEPQDRHVNQ